jgi:hypothetical protein
MPRTLAFRTIENGTAIVAVGPNTPDDADWAQLVEAMKKDRHQRTLVVTAGGGPSAAQRKAILDASGGKGLPAAILTDSVVVRGIATAISWFVPDVRAYPPGDLQSALDHLKITTPQRAVQRVIDELKHEMAAANGRAQTG